MKGGNGRLAAGKTMTGSQITSAPTLLQEFLDPPEGHSKTPGNLLAGAFVRS
jgi:hypothetical protein